MASWYECRDDEVTLALRIQPKASRDQFAGIQGDRLKVRITAPPVDGKANEHLLAFLAKTFRVAKSQVQLLSGETGREKRVRITGTRLWPQFLAEVTQIKAA
ncbi:DUF167 family protein [Methylogaea oryzae]|uniref:UPF0235 protein MoryE10_00270 n=1 Tax=Methylogaea oryzae TaxID=1295382 RepID=A0A8D5AIW2_9GAMM|nr:DUF167 family protein [Methylogaea oryzae]BBL69421.1 UPF0235 protein [Methylogaea oryzae]